MPGMEIKAYAKLNLTLDVLRRRGDGYHDLRMVMQTVDVSDTVTLETGGEGGLTVQTDVSFLPTDERNLAAAAALRFREETGKGWDGLAIGIRKRVPVCAGMGGGSSDAAAVLRALNLMTGANLSPQRLVEIGARVGSDVPYCVLGGTVLAEGRGDILSPLPPLPACHILVCKPRFFISTPELFSRINCARICRRPDTAGIVAALGAGDLPGVARRLYNVFEDVLPPRHAAEIRQIKKTLIDGGALGANMSGTGPTVFGMFADEARARTVYAALGGIYRDVHLTGPISY